MQIPQDKFTRITARVIAKNRGDDPVSLAEKIIERLSEEFEDVDSGVFGVPTGGRPPKQEEELEVDMDTLAKFRAKGPQKVKDPGPVYPPSSQRSIVLPGDAEFEKAVRMTEAERREQIGKATTGYRITKVEEPGGTSDVEYWTYEKLIEEVTRNTPDRFFFVPNGMEPDCKVLAVRNILSKYPFGFIQIQYSNPQVSGDRVDRDGNGEAIPVFGLTATYDFKTTDRVIDTDAAMNKLVDQLKGMYAPRGGHIGDREIGPSLMDSWSNAAPGMKGSVDVRGTNNWGMVGNGTVRVKVGNREYDVPDTKQAIAEQVIAVNRRG